MLRDLMPTSEEHTFFGQPLNTWGWHGIAVGLHVAAGIVRMKVQDVRLSSVHAVIFFLPLFG